jgi:hypothetical protein
MVNVEKHESLLSDCKTWLESLKSRKVHINHLRNELYKAAAGKTDMEYLKEVEHYHNLFHIQQINIHDLKHKIKSHIAEAERHPNFGHKIPHHNLEIQYNFLIKDIDQLSKDFLLFVKTS